MTLAEWVAGAWRLENDLRICQRWYDRTAAHWRALTVPMIHVATRSEVEFFLRVIGRWNARGPWRKPLRGGRGGSWGIFNVEARNRIARLDQLADRESITAGANWKGANR